jgi:DNA recombination protein RmuC
MDIGLSVLVGGSIGALWVVRELMGYRQRLEFNHLRQRYQILENEWNAGRKEILHLREMNGHMQTMVKDQAMATVESRKDIESRLQSICSQTLVGAQKTFLTHLQPILSQFQQSTTGQLKEQSSFLTQLVGPLEHYLQDMRQHIHTLEQTRVGAYSGLKEQIGHLAEGQKVLSMETNALMNAFRTPHIRGCWGEMQLRRVVELAGMVAYCDFQQHPTLATEKRHGVRPDMIIRLPGKKSIIVDSKAPMTHYLESTSAKTSAEYQAKIKDHARVLGTHIKALSDKKYWSYQEHAVELTVLFLPGEAFLSAALEGDANLLEFAAQKNIILATPILCIALLKTIAQGWRQDLFSQKTHRIIAMSQDLSTRLEKFHGHLLAVGKALKNGQLAYHAAVGVFQETIVPTVQQLGSIVPDDATTEPLDSPEPLLSKDSLLGSAQEWGDVDLFETDFSEAEGGKAGAMADETGAGEVAEMGVDLSPASKNPGERSQSQEIGPEVSSRLTLEPPIELDRG